jgi:hypothetical protein
MSISGIRTRHSAATISRLGYPPQWEAHADVIELLQTIHQLEYLLAHKVVSTHVYPRMLHACDVEKVIESQITGVSHVRHA